MIERGASEALEREEAEKRGPPFIVESATLQVILRDDPVAMTELMRPDGFIVIEPGAPIPSARELNAARGIITWSNKRVEGGNVKEASE